MGLVLVGPLLVFISNIPWTLVTQQALHVISTRFLPKTCHYFHQSSWGLFHLLSHVKNLESNSGRFHHRRVLCMNIYPVCLERIMGTY